MPREVRCVSPRRGNRYVICLGMSIIEQMFPRPMADVRLMLTRLKMHLKVDGEEGDLSGLRSVCLVEIQ